MTLPSDIPDAATVRRLHAERCTRWHDTPTPDPAEGFLGLVEENHWRNFSLWHEEDEARREDIGAEGVRNAKRAIDRHNQARNDFIERMDQWLEQRLAPDPDAPANSETPGMIIDRLSILSLKEYHMEEETRRTDASPEHHDRCRQRLAVIRRQLSDLGTCLDQLLAQTAARTRSFRTYYQFKMYNDPNLNPALYKRQTT